MRGEKTPKHIVTFIVKTKLSDRRLSNSEIARQVDEKFGEHDKLDKSTVGRILGRNGFSGSGGGRKGRPQPQLRRLVASLYDEVPVPAGRDIEIQRLNNFLEKESGYLLVSGEVDELTPEQETRGDSHSIF